jgi:hypothetical protein
MRPFLNERRTRGPLEHSVAGNRGRARFLGFAWETTALDSHFSAPGQPTCLQQVEREMRLQLQIDARPGGPAAKLQPSPEGLGINPQDHLSAVGAALNLFHRQRRLGAPLPDFLWRLVALIHSMRLSLMKGAHADLSSTAWQEIGVKPGFGLSGIPQDSTCCFIRWIRVDPGMGGTP